MGSHATALTGGWDDSEAFANVQGHARKTGTTDNRVQRAKTPCTMDFQVRREFRSLVTTDADKSTELEVDRTCRLSGAVAKLLLSVDPQALTGGDDSLAQGFDIAASDRQVPHLAA